MATKKKKEPEMPVAEAPVANPEEVKELLTRELTHVFKDKIMVEYEGSTCHYTEDGQILVSMDRPDTKGVIRIKPGTKAIRLLRNYFDKKPKTIVLPESLVAIEESSFPETGLNIESDSKYFKVIKGVLYTADMKTLLYAKGSKNVIIPDGVTRIGAGAFNNAKKLESISIPNSITSIGDGAFNFCESLQSVVIPDSVTSIGSSAFYGCHSLQSIVIPDSASIEKNAFDCCPITVAIPNNGEDGKKLIFANSLNTVGTYEITWNLKKGEPKEKIQELEDFLVKMVPDEWDERIEKIGKHFYFDEGEISKTENGYVSKAIVICDDIYECIDEMWRSKFGEDPFEAFDIELKLLDSQKATRKQIYHQTALYFDCEWTLNNDAPKETVEELKNALEKASKGAEIFCLNIHKLYASDIKLDGSCLKALIELDCNNKDYGDEEELMSTALNKAIHYNNNFENYFTHDYVLNEIENN